MTNACIVRVIGGVADEAAALARAAFGGVSVYQRMSGVCRWLMTPLGLCAHSFSTC